MITYEHFMPKYIAQLTFEDDVLFASAFNMTNEANQFLKIVLNKNIFIEDMFRISDMEIPELIQRKAVIIISNSDVYVLFVMPEGYTAQKYYERHNKLIVDCVKNTYGINASRCHYIAMTHLGNKSVTRETTQFKKDEVVLINIDYRNNNSEFGKAMSDFTLENPDEMQSVFMKETLQNSRERQSSVFLIKSLVLSTLSDAVLDAANLLNKGISTTEVQAKTKLSTREIERIKKLI